MEMVLSSELQSWYLALPETMRRSTANRKLTLVMTGQVHEPSKESPSEAGVAVGGGEGRKQEVQREIGEDKLCVCETCGAIACVSCDRPYHNNET